MADEVAQAPAVQGVETTQALLHQQLQVFPGFILCRLYSPFVTVHFASSYVSLVFLLCTLASRYLAASPRRFYSFPFLYFSTVLLRSLLHICRLRAFLSVPACLCFSFSTLVIFHVLVHGFVMFRPECGMRSQGDFITVFSP